MWIYGQLRGYRERAALRFPRLRIVWSKWTTEGAVKRTEIGYVKFENLTSLFQVFRDVTHALIAANVLAFDKSANLFSLRIKVAPRIYFPSLA
jgi:hypothetical protein